MDDLTNARVVRRTKMKAKSVFRINSRTKTIFSCLPTPSMRTHKITIPSDLSFESDVARVEA